MGALGTTEGLLMRIYADSGHHVVLCCPPEQVAGMFRGHLSIPGTPLPGLENAQALRAANIERGEC